LLLLARARAGEAKTIQAFPQFQKKIGNCVQSFFKSFPAPVSSPDTIKEIKLEYS